MSSDGEDWSEFPGRVTTVFSSFLIVFHERAGFRVRLLHTHGNHWQCKFHRVGLFVGQSLCFKHGFLSGTCPDAPIELRIALARHLNLPRRTGQHIQAFHVER